MIRVTILFLSVLFLHPDITAQWFQLTPPTDGILWNVRFLNENIVWIKGSDHYQSSDSAYIFKTTDGGLTWVTSDTWQGSSYGTLYIVDELKVLYSRDVAGPGNGDLRMTTDGGATWETVDSVDGWHEDIEFVDPNTGYAVGGYAGNDGFVRKTTDGGATWAEILFLDERDLTGVSFLSPSEGWISVYWNELHFTTDGGNTWIKDSSYSPPSTPTRDVQFTSSDSGWAVGGIGGSLTISRTTDGGSSWSYYSPMCGSSLREVQMVSSQMGWVVGSINCPPYIARTTDGGNTWETQVSADEFESISMVNEHYGWASGEWGTLYHTSNGGVTWVEGGKETPLDFSLHQNYPNPFNAISNFGFGIPKFAHVSLTIYDLLGQEIATIVNESLSPGSYTRQWDATGQPSGVYFYRLRAGEFVETRKLMLIK